MTLALAALLLVAVQMAYGKFGRGVEFFPKVEPDYGQVIVHGRGNLSLDEKNRAGRRGREARARRSPGLKTVYTRVGEQPRGIERTHRGHDRRHPVRVRRLADAAAGARDHGRDPRQDRRHSRHPGRGDGAARRSADRQADPGAARARSIRPCCRRPPSKVAAMLAARSDVRDLDDGLPLPGIDWKIEVDKAEAAKYGAGVNTVGTAVQLVTNGAQGHRIPAGRQRQGGRHPGALPARPAQPRPDRRTARPDAGRPRADRQFRAARAGAARRLHQPRQRQPRDDGVGERRRGRADRQGAAGDRRASSPRPISVRASPSSSRARTRSARRRGAS